MTGQISRKTIVGNGLPVVCKAKMKPRLESFFLKSGSSSDFFADRGAAARLAPAASPVLRQSGFQGTALSGAAADF